MGRRGIGHGYSDGHGWPGAGRGTVVGGCTLPCAAEELPFRAEPSACLPVGPGPEDFEVLRQADGSTRLFASTKTRRLWRKRSDDGAIVEVRLDRNGQVIAGPKPVWPALGGRGLQPVGLSLTEIDGEPWLYVIDSGGDQQRGAPPGS